LSAVKIDLWLPLLRRFILNLGEWHTIKQAIPNNPIFGAG